MTAWKKYVAGINEKVKRWVVCSDGYVRLRDVKEWRVRYDKTYKQEQYFEDKETALRKAYNMAVGQTIYRQRLLDDLKEKVDKAILDLIDAVKEEDRRYNRLPKL